MPHRYRELGKPVREAKFQFAEERDINTLFLRCKLPIVFNVFNLLGYNSTPEIKLPLANIIRFFKFERLKLSHILQLSEF